jgi:hypothetical protein
MVYLQQVEGMVWVLIEGKLMAALPAEGSIDVEKKQQQ